MTPAGSGLADELRLAFEHAPVCCVALRLDLTILAATRAFLQTTQTSREAIVGKPIIDVLAGDAFELEPDAVAELRACLAGVIERGQAESLSIRRRDARRTADGVDDERHWRLVNIPVFDAEGALTHIIHQVEDVTASRRAARVAEEMRVAREAAEVSSVAKEDFLSSMSHELRNPLNAVLGFAQLLERDKAHPLAARQRERVHQILRSGEHLLCLINDILDLSRVEAGAVSISPEPIGLAELLAEVESTLEPMAAACRVRIEVEARTGERSTVVADRTRLRQILMNFGSNAIKYNRPAGVVVFSISTPTDALLRLSVRDNGIGIPLAKQGRIFQPFERAGQECGPIEGSGIGLMVTKRLAALMGGSVGFVSRPAEGSEFWVDMPIHGEPPRWSDERRL